MTAIKRFRTALQEYHISADIVAEIFKNYENISDKVEKGKRAAFFITAIQRMESILDSDLCQHIRDACACSKGGWRLKSMQKIARDHHDQGLVFKLQAIGQVTYMGKPVLNEDGTILAGIGDEGGFHCVCPVFDSIDVKQAVSKTYCCAGHFRYHYQIALEKQLRTKEVVSSALNSQSKEPCRFIYEIIE